MDASDKRVLIIDDDVFLRDMYAKKFSDMSHDVEVASGADEALEKLRNGSFNIILLDLVMPGTDGFELFGQAKDEDLFGDAKVVVLTNQSREEDMEKARGLGAHGYIVKASLIPTEVVVESVNIAEAGSEDMIVKQ